MDGAQTFSLALAVAALSAPAPAAAQLSYTDEDRSVETSSRSSGALWDTGSNPFFPDFDPPVLTLTDTATDSAAAPGSSPFGASVATSDPLLLALAPEGSATASQTSSLSASQAVASGSVTGIGHSRTLTQAELDLANFYFSPSVPFDFGTLGDEEDASADFSATFDVASATPYRLTGSLALSAAERVEDTPGYEITYATGSIVLTGPEGVVASVALDQADSCGFTGPCLPSSDDLDVEGTLAPGSYTLSARVGGVALGGCTEVTHFACYAPGVGGSFDLALTLGPPPFPSLPLSGLLSLAAALAAAGRAPLRRR
jgi:hypothetical protein